MRVFTAFALAAGLSAAASAQTDFTQLPRAEALERFEVASEEGLEALALIYTRIDPDLVEYMGSFEWDEVDREAAACVYDAYVEAGELDHLNMTYAASQEVVERIREDESITMIALFSGQMDRSVLEPDLPADMAERNIEVATACGTLEANARRFSNPELTQRLMSLLEQAQ